jgi:outer membrane lipoprotein-sorting protein
MKMKHQLLYLLFTCFTATVSAQSFTPVKDEADMRKKIAEVAKTSTSVKADFVQVKSLAMLSEKITSKGTFYFKKENKVRLEYHQPFNYLLVINDGKILIKDDAKSTQMDMHKNKVFQQVNNIIISCVNGSAISSTDFNVKMFENSSQLKLEMKPISKGLKDFFSGIAIFIDKKDYSVIRIEMNEMSGDNTIITFSNKELNGSLDDKLFSVSK